MQVAAQHPEAVSKCTRPGMEERFLFDRIALHAGDIAPRDLQTPMIVVADFADADCARGDCAVVPTGVATDPLAFEPIVDIAFTSALVQQLAQAGHVINCTRPSFRRRRVNRPRLPS